MAEENKEAAGKYADVPLRVKTWIWIVLALAAGISHPLAMQFFVAWISFQAFGEFLRIFGMKRYLLLMPAVLGTVQFLLLHFLKPEGYFTYSFVLLPFIAVFAQAIKATRKQIWGGILGGIIVLFAFPHLAFIRAPAFGLKALIFLIVVTELNDVFQYLMGKAFGKRKITPALSPNKTVEGFIGGVFLTVILSILLGHFLLPTSLITNAILGLLLGIAGFFGDVLMSAIKRSTGVKDTGTLLPGHGGLLDRMDSLIFNAPVFFWLLPVLLKN